MLKEHAVPIESAEFGHAYQALFWAPVHTHRNEPHGNDPITVKVQGTDSDVGGARMKMVSGASFLLTAVALQRALSVHEQIARGRIIRGELGQGADRPFLFTRRGWRESQERPIAVLFRQRIKIEIAFWNQ